MRSVQHLMDLRDRVAVVTGAAGFIGGAICDALAELNATVVLVDVDEERSARQAARLAERGSAATMCLAVNLAEQDSVASVAPRVRERFGRLDVLVNCAALVGSSELRGWAVDFRDQSADVFRMALDVNLVAPVFLVQSCLDLLRASGHASVINVSSIYGLVGPHQALYEGTSMGNPAAYAASKGALIQMTRWLATTLAPEVRVNAISPGGILRGQPDSFQQRYVERTPLKRMGREEDLKGAAAFLASDLSAYVTGHNLVVDGGWTAW